MPAILLYYGRGNQIRKGVIIMNKKVEKTIPEKQTDWADYMLAGCFMAIVIVCVYVCVCAYA